MRKRILLMLCLVATLFTTGGCGSAHPATLTVAEQFGIAYAPLEILNPEGLLAKALPNVTIRWVQMGGPTAIREGMLSGDIDVGFMGIGPMLIGVDTGMPWKSIGALSANEVAFMTNRADIHTLADLKPSDRVAVLSPGSTQHVLLCMAAKQQLGDALALDAQLVSLSHPDALSAMLAGGEVAMHVTTPPYIDLELAQGMHKLMSGEDVLGGPFTFICGVANTAFRETHRDWYDTFRSCLTEAIGILNADLPAAAHRLAALYGVEESVLLQEMSYHGSIYGTTLRGVDRMAAAMAELKLLRTAPDSTAYAFPEVEVQP